MAPTYWNIVDSYLTFMTSSQFEFGLLRSYSQQMDVSWGILIKWHWLKKNVVAICLSCDFIGLIYNFVDGFVNFESVRIHLLANLAFKSFPVERSNVLVLSTWWFFLFLSEDPTLQALEMNETNSSFAFACYDKRVLLIIFVAPADSALNLVHIFVLHDIFYSSYLHGLSQFLVV